MNKYYCPHGMSLLFLIPIIQSLIDLTGDDFVETGLNIYLLIPSLSIDWSNPYTVPSLSALISSFFRVFVLPQVKENLGKHVHENQ
jgi:hypothetical protein